MVGNISLKRDKKEILKHQKINITNFVRVSFQIKALKNSYKACSLSAYLKKTLASPKLYINTSNTKTHKNTVPISDFAEEVTHSS